MNSGHGISLGPPPCKQIKHMALFLLRQNGVAAALGHWHPKGEQRKVVDAPEGVVIGRGTEGWSMFVRVRMSPLGLEEADQLQQAARMHDRKGHTLIPPDASALPNSVGMYPP